MRKNITIVFLAVLAIFGFGLTGAQAAGLIGTHQIRDNSVRSVDIHNGTLRKADLNKWLQHQLAQHAKDGKDGAPGLSNIQAGADYTHVWPGNVVKTTDGQTTYRGHSDAELQTIVAKCQDGQYAVSGGYSTWGGSYDLGGDTHDNIKITVSAPMTENYVPISDTNSNFRPTEWVVKGYNYGSQDQIVRAWVVCADAAN